MTAPTKQDPITVTLVPEADLEKARQRGQEPKREGLDTALNLIRQSRQTPVKSPQSIPRRLPQGPGDDVTAANNARAIANYIDALNDALGERLEATLRAIKTARQNPTDLPPSEALAHIANLAPQRQQTLCAPKKKTRGRPLKKRDDNDARLQELYQQYAPMLAEQVARGLKRRPTPPRLARIKSGDALRVQIKEAAEKLKMAGVPPRKWVRIMLDDSRIKADESHIRRVLRSLGYRS